jgi:hypothetical protein
MKWFFEPKKSLGIPSIGKIGKPAKHRTNKLRAILAGVIAACSMLGLSTPARALTFSDVPSGHWAYDAVNDVSNWGYMAGVGGGLFSPDTNLMREQIIQIFYSVAGTPAVATSVTEPYDDVASGQWFYNPVRWAYSNGLAAFVQASSTHLGGGTPLPRAQIAQAFWKFAQIQGKAISNAPGFALSDYCVDAGSMTTAQQNAVKWCYAFRIMSGTAVNATTQKMTFSPAGSVTRAQMAVMVKAYCTRLTLSYWYSNENAIGKWLIAPTLYYEKRNNNADFKFAVGIVAGREAWASALNVNITYTGGESTAKIKYYGGNAADILAIGIFGPIPPDIGGLTNWGVNDWSVNYYDGGIYKYGSQTKNLRIAKNVVGYLLDFGSGVTESEYKMMAIHEMGHAMGWRGHASDSSWIMYASYTSVTTLKSGEINHLKQIY